MSACCHVVYVCVCVCVRNSIPETVGVHVSPTEASEQHKEIQQRGNTPHLWLHEEAPS